MDDTKGPSIGEYEGGLADPTDEASELLGRIRATDGAEVHSDEWGLAEELLARGLITLGAPRGPGRAFRRAEPVLGPRWTTRDGRVIPLAAMDDAHLVNALRFLRRECMTITEIFACLRYAKGAPDGAAMAAEDEVARARLMPAIFEDMEVEAKRRGLAWWEL